MNPSVFGCVTFPFLFAVMFGDLCHGTILFLIGIMLCLFAEPLKKTAIGGIVMARYLILLMGFFATYIGLCSNDFTSIPIEGGSCYTVRGTEVARDTDCVYAIGIDPVWYGADNELEFINNLKMKTSVIFGVAQMSLGIFMKAFNSLYFKRYLDFYFEFIPQIILLWVLFGWMDLLIVVKWLTPWDNGDERMSTSEAPAIIGIMINMFLKFGKVEGAENGTYLIGGLSGQQTISLILLAVTFISVPVMLCVKPCILKHKMKRAHIHDSGDYNRLDDEDESHLIDTNQKEEQKTQTDIGDRTVPFKARQSINLD